MPQSKTPFLSLIIPVYKQEKIIIANLKEVLQTLEKTRYSYEVIVVIDGQVDHSFEKIKQQKFNHLTVYQYTENRGKSYAIRFGMSKAKGEHIMFLDSGMEIHPGGISMLLEHMKWYDADIIVGSKRHPASLVNYNWQRKILSLGYYYFVRLLFGIKVHDTQAGIKVFKKDALEKILPRLVEKRFAGDLEILVVAKTLGFGRIYEAPIKLNYQFSNLSNAATLNSIWMIFLDTLAIYYRSHILGYYRHAHKHLIQPEKVQRHRFK